MNENFLGCHKAGVGRGREGVGAGGDGGLKGGRGNRESIGGAKSAQRGGGVKEGARERGRSVAGW